MQAGGWPARRRRRGHRSLHADGSAMIRMRHADKVRRRVYVRRGPRLRHTNYWQPAVLSSCKGTRRQAWASSTRTPATSRFSASVPRVTITIEAFFLRERAASLAVYDLRPARIPLGNIYLADSWLKAEYEQTLAVRYFAGATTTRFASAWKWARTSSRTP